MNPSQETIKVSNICQGCLSSDRKLSTVVGQFKKLLYCIMMYEDKNQLMDVNCIDNEEFMLCWECWKMLLNTLKFHRRVKNAQAALSTATHHLVCINSVASLSKLSVSLKTGFDLKLNVKEKKIKEKKERTLKIEYDKVILPLQSKIKSESEAYGEHDYLSDDNFPLSYINNSEVTVTQAKQESILFDDENETIGIKLEKDHDQENRIFSKESADRSQLKLNKKKKKQNYKPPPIRGHYELINTELNTEQSYERIPITLEHFKEFMESQKQSDNYTKYEYKCECCVSVYRTKKCLEYHKKKSHDSKLKRKCDVCSYTFATENELSNHVKEHQVKFKCLLCSESFYRRFHLYAHLNDHRNSMRCLDCGLEFIHRRSFFKHYREMHRNFICDHCGRRLKYKQSMIKHMRKHMETGPVSCKQCGVVCKTSRGLTEHVKRLHVVAKSEATYCVECDIMFDNLRKFKSHLSSSVAHRAPVIKSIPCPVCGKVYRKMCTMKNHYRLVHEQQTKHYCASCDRYFLNGFRYRQHVATKHQNWKMPKDKLCSICGRGFSTRRILENHIRTHTGERPYECDNCSAKFAQRSALVTHVRNIHKIKINYADQLATNHRV